MKKAPHKKVADDETIVVCKKFFFLNDFEKGEILRKGFSLKETTFFYQTSETGQILPKTVFLP